jgi:hypothetical protein
MKDGGWWICNFHCFYPATRQEIGFTEAFGTFYPAERRQEAAEDPAGALLGDGSGFGIVSGALE